MVCRFPGSSGRRTILAFHAVELFSSISSQEVLQGSADSSTSCQEVSQGSADSSTSIVEVVK